VNYDIAAAGGCAAFNTSAGIGVIACAYYSRATGNVGDAIWSLTPSGAASTAIFTNAVNMIVQSPNVVTINANITVKDLDIQTGSNLTLASTNSLDIKGTSAILAGTVTANTNSTLSITEASTTTLTITGTVDLYNFTSASATSLTITGGMDIRGTLLLDDGDFNASGATVRLRSTVSGTGRLGPVAATADFIGDLRVQRYIPGGATNWRLFGTPTGSNTVQDWNNDFFTAGFLGSDFPNFTVNAQLWPSIRWYNETNTGSNPNDGLTGVANTTDLLVTGRGYAAWCGDNLGGTAAFVVDVNGPPTIAQTPLSLPLTWTDTSVLTADGWNLVSNPLASPIDFDQITRNGSVEDRYYVYDPSDGTTAVWDAGTQTSTPLNALNGTIQSSQGFWLKTTGTAPTASVVEASKVAGNDGGLFGGDEAPVLPIMRLTMRGSTGNWKDEATLIFDGGTEALEGLDALKFDFSHPSAPRIATRTSDGHDVILNRFGAFASNIAIPVTARVPSNGTYSITVSLSGLQMLTCFTLVDLLTGTTTPLTDGAVYSFTMTATANVVADRFVLQGTTPVLYAATDALCGGTATGSVAVQLTEATELLTLGDALGNPVQQVSNVPAGEYTFSDLVADNYTVSVGSTSACGTLSAPVVVFEPFALEASIEALPSTCASEADGSVALSILGGQAPFSFVWSTGSTAESITGVAGNYTALVTDAAGCTLNVEAAIPAGPGPEALFETNGEPVLVNEPIEFVNLSTLDAVEYTWDFGDGSTSANFNATHSYALPGAYTVTLTVSDGVCTAVFTQEVMVQLTTGVSTPAKPMELVKAWVAGDMIVVDVGFDHGRPVYIAVLDATGKLHLQQQVSGTPGRVQLPATTLSTGIWFVRVTSEPVQRTIRVPILR